jgi:ATP-dependent Clp protease ATP-binding subunit ClpA
MVRIDMSEYQERHTVSRLVGAPPGYVGFDEGGQLTEAVRRRPYRVVLFDEVEKAHIDVFNILLQIMEDGRLTDGHGRTVDFKNTVVIMTSNLGSRHLQGVEPHDAAAFEMARVLVLGELRKTVRPEFLNRIDEVIVFRPLSEEQLVDIVGLLIRGLSARLASQGIGLDITDAAKRHLAKEGYSPDFGARPLRRLIQKEIENTIARKILGGEIKSGEMVVVDFTADRLVFATQAAAGVSSS